MFVCMSVSLPVYQLFIQCVPDKSVSYPFIYPMSQCVCLFAHATLCNEGNEHCSQHCATRETNIARNIAQRGKRTLLATLRNEGNEHCSQHCATRETNIARNTVQRGKRTLLATLCNKGKEHCSQRCATWETNIARNTVQQEKRTLLATPRITPNPVPLHALA